MLYQRESQGVVVDRERARVAVRLLTQYGQLASNVIIRVVDDCDREWPHEPARVIERFARQRLEALGA
jgi:hypothetical protein